MERSFCSLTHRPWHNKMKRVHNEMRGRLVTKLAGRGRPVARDPAVAHRVKGLLSKRNT